MFQDLNCKIIHNRLCLLARSSHDIAHHAIRKEKGFYVRYYFVQRHILPVRIRDRKRHVRAA